MGNVGHARVGHAHRVFLIRHGESIDNVAGLYAGIRDSPLTNHGAQQAARLGEHLAKSGVIFTKIFCSDLRRAVKTAEALSSAQPAGHTSTAVQLPQLREQDFGSLEGQPYHARPFDMRKASSEACRHVSSDEPEFQKVESTEAMAKRCFSFLDEHLMPLLREAQPGETLSTAIVSHGILLSSLWRCLLLRQARNTVFVEPAVMGTRTGLTLEHLGGWSNTGYLEIEFCHTDTKPLKTDAEKSANPNSSCATRYLNDVGEVEAHQSDYIQLAAKCEDQLIAECVAEGTAAGASCCAVSSGYTIAIKTINGKEHLKGLKRTGGGVGSSRFDEGQRSIKTFFKKQKTQYEVVATKKVAGPN